MISRDEKEDEEKHEDKEEKVEDGKNLLTSAGLENKPEKAQGNKQAVL